MPEAGADLIAAIVGAERKIAGDTAAIRGSVAIVMAGVGEAALEVTVAAGLAVAMRTGIPASAVLAEGTLTVVVTSMTRETREILDSAPPQDSVGAATQVHGTLGTEVTV